jgi:serine/threonine protein kinase
VLTFDSALPAVAEKPCFFLTARRRASPVCGRTGTCTEAPRRGKIAGAMPWSWRVSVVQALEYIHERCEPQVVHGNMKASNMLLDATMSAKLCDFGRPGWGSPLSSAHGRRRTPCSAPWATWTRTSPPHYVRSGVVTKKTQRVGEPTGLML